MSPGVAQLLVAYFLKIQAIINIISPISSPNNPNLSVCLKVSLCFGIVNLCNITDKNKAKKVVMDAIKTNRNKGFLIIKID